MDYNNRFARKSFNNRGSSDRFGGRDKELFTAECAACHNKCEVPFRPNGKKPVYCSNCFVKDGESAPRGDRRDFSRETSSYERPAAARPDNSSFELKRELQAVNEKLERLISIMEGAVRVEEEMVTPAPTKAASKQASKPASVSAPKPAKAPKKAVKGKKKK